MVDHDQILVPKDQEVKHMILQEFYNSILAGHLGIRKTVKNILRYFNWPNIWAEADSYLQHCPPGQQGQQPEASWTDAAK